MEVQMRNCLAAFGACIDNETEAFFSNSKFFCYFRQDFLYMSHQFHRRRNDIFRVFLGNDEDMDWCYGTKVIDGNDFIIFIDAGLGISPETILQNTQSLIKNTSFS